METSNEATAYDETQMRNSEILEQLRKRTEELQSARKDLEAFSYSVSHDLRAPLRSIEGFSRIVLRDSADKLDETAKDSLQRVINAALRMDQLINDMLILSRVTQIQMSHDPVDLSAIASSIVSQFREREGQRKVDFNCAQGVVVRGEPQLLRIVIENLLGNAWKFTARRESGRIEFGVMQNEKEIAYFVSDNGAGFDMAYAGRLFIPFQRLHSSSDFPGAGIGLATVQRIIHRHGGRVWCEGTVDQGAKFYFTVGS